MKFRSLGLGVSAFRIAVPPAIVVTCVGIQWNSIECSIENIHRILYDFETVTGEFANSNGILCDASFCFQMLTIPNGAPHIPAFRIRQFQFDFKGLKN